MSNQTQQSMLKALLETLKNESDETKRMFLVGQESDLLRAYQEGSNACLSETPIGKNPYPRNIEDNDSGKYNMNICWTEGYTNTYIEIH